MASRINIRESLNRLDLQTDNKYDLRNIYDCSKISDDKKKKLAEALNKNASAKTISRILDENSSIKIFPRDSEEYEKLDRVATFLTAMSPNKYYYYVGKTYFDYGQDWKWTTILAQKNDNGLYGDSYQALNPREQKEIILANSDEELEEIAKDILRHAYVDKGFNESLDDEVLYENDKFKIIYDGKFYNLIGKENDEVYASYYNLDDAKDDAIKDPFYESLTEAINAKDSMIAQEFNYTMQYGDQSSDVNAAVIIIPGGLKIDGKPADLTVYAEDENGEVINFKSVEEANDWINKYKDDVEFHIEHGNELHATPMAYYNSFDESLDNDALEYDDEMSDTWADMFDIASPKEVANTFGKNVKSKNKIYRPSKNESFDIENLMRKVDEYLFYNKNVERPKGYIGKNDRGYSDLLNRYGDYFTTSFRYVKVDDLIDYAKEHGIINESLTETNYGGAYDIEDDMFFTKEDIVEFAEEVCEYLGDTFGYQYDINNVYMDSPKKLYINIYDNNYIEVESTFNIDMRKIRQPSDLFRVYGLTIENWFQKAFAREYRDAGLDESLTEAKKVGSNKISQGMNLPGKNFELIKITNGIVSSKDRYECRIYSKELDDNKDYGFYQGEVIFSEDYDPQLIDSVFPDEGTEVKLAIYRVPEDDPDHDWTGDYFVDYIDETNESLTEEVEEEQLYKVVIKNGSNELDFESNLSYEDAQEIVDYYNGRWIDEDGYEWSMEIEEDELEESLNESTDFNNKFLDIETNLRSDYYIRMKSGKEKVDTVYLQYEPSIDDYPHLVGYAHDDEGHYDWAYLDSSYIENLDVSPYMDSDGNIVDVNRMIEENPDYFYIKFNEGPISFDESLNESPGIISDDFGEYVMGFNEWLLDKYGVTSDNMTDDDYDYYFKKYVVDYYRNTEEGKDYPIPENLDEQINLPGYAVKYVTGYAGNGVNNSETEWFRTEEERDKRVKELEDKNYTDIKTWKMDNFYHTLPKEESLNETYKFIDSKQLEKNYPYYFHYESNNPFAAEDFWRYAESLNCLKVEGKYKDSQNVIFFVCPSEESYNKLLQFNKKNSLLPWMGELSNNYSNDYDQLVVKFFGKPKKLENLKEDIEDEYDFEESDFNDGEVEEGVYFFADGENYAWVERIAGPIHLDFDNWAVWSAKEIVPIQDFIIGKNEQGGYDVDRDAYIAAINSKPIVYFVVDEDTGFIDWGPVETRIEAQDFLNGKVEDWENDEEYEDSLTESRAIKAGDDFEVTLHYDDIGDGKEYDYTLGYDEVVSYLKELAWSNGDGPEDLNEDEYLEWVMDNFDELTNKYELNVLNYFESEASQYEYDHRYDEP